MIVRVPCTLLGIRSFTQKNGFCGDSMRMLKKIKSLHTLIVPFGGHKY